MVDQAVQLREICETYRPRILRYLARLIGEEEAEDVTQDVLFKISKNLPEFRGDSSLNTWIYRIVTNSAIDSLRRRRANPPPALEWVMTDGGVDDAYGEDPADAEEAVPSVEVGMIRSEMGRCILEFVERLPEDYRIVMTLRELEGFSNAEIATIVGVSLDTVKIRLHRARNKLRQELASGCKLHRDERNEFACDRKS